MAEGRKRLRGGGWSLQIGMGSWRPCECCAVYMEPHFDSKAFWSFVGKKVLQVFLDFYSRILDFWREDIVEIRKGKTNKHVQCAHMVPVPTLRYLCISFLSAATWCAFSSRGTVIRIHGNPKVLAKVHQTICDISYVIYHRLFFYPLLGDGLKLLSSLGNSTKKVLFFSVPNLGTEHAITCLRLITVAIPWTAKTNAGWRSGLKLKNSSKKAISAPG